MFVCPTCRNEYEDDARTPSGACCFCAERERFAAFAQRCGLTLFPDPSGERYLYHLNGTCAGKKGECINFMDELWNALVRAKKGGGDLLLS